VSSKRSPQTAAKRDREQAVREKRMRKAEKKANTEPGEEQAAGPPPVFQETPTNIVRPNDIDF
jgi:hypothetical protein